MDDMIRELKRLETLKKACNKEMSYIIDHTVSDRSYDGDMRMKKCFLNYKKVEADIEDLKRAIRKFAF